MFPSTYNRSFHFGDEDTVLKKSDNDRDAWREVSETAKQLLIMTTILHNSLTLHIDFDKFTQKNATIINVIKLPFTE